MQATYTFPVGVTTLWWYAPATTSLQDDAKEESGQESVVADAANVVADVTKEAVSGNGVTHDEASGNGESRGQYSGNGGIHEEEFEDFASEPGAHGDFTRYAGEGGQVVVQAYRRVGGGPVEDGGYLKFVKGPKN